jgi:putative endonuclease
MPVAGAVYFVYILTNPAKSVLYIGVTNNLMARLKEHWDNRGNDETFAGKYFCYNLIYYETSSSIELSIAREKELKKWSRDKKEALIRSQNPDWLFLNRQICKEWPPKNISKRF